MNLLDGVINVLLGPDSSQMSEEDRKQTEKQRAQNRNEAQHNAASARFNPGEQFMYGPEKAGIMESNGSLETIAKIVQLFA